MANNPTCPVCGYDPGRDESSHPSLAPVKGDSVLHQGRTPPALAEILARLDRLEEENRELREVAAAVANNYLWKWKDGEISRRTVDGLPVYLEELHLSGYVRSAQITALSDSCFSNSRGLRRIWLPESVRRIGDRAFRDCQRLEEVHIAGELEEIGEEAFWSCENLRSLSFPGPVRRIGGYPFRNSGLEEIRFEAGGPPRCDRYQLFFGCAALRTVRVPRNWEAVAGRWVLPDGAVLQYEER